MLKNQNENRLALSHALLFYSLLALAGGILLQRIFPQNGGYFYGAGIIITAIFSRHNILWRRAILYFVLLFCLGYHRAQQQLPQTSQPFICRGTWQISDFPQHNKGFGYHFPLRLLTGDCPQLNAELIANHYQSSPPPLGAIFTAPLQIRAGTFRYYTHLTTPDHLQPPPAFSLIQLRKTLHQRLKQLFPAEQQRWLNALIIGNQNELTRLDRIILQKTGTSHLLAISGLHLGIVIALFYLLSSRLISFSQRLTAYAAPRSIGLISGLIFGGIFALISGAHTPVIRSWIMFATLAGTWFFPRLNIHHHNLTLAAIFVLIFDPAALFSLSAWLSFLATLTVIIVITRWRHHSPLQQWLGLQWLLSLILLPLIWAVFGGISLSGFWVNCIVIPLLAPLLLSIFLGLCCPFFADFAAAFVQNYLNFITIAANTPFAYLTPNWQPQIIPAALVSIAFLCGLLRHQRLALLGIMIAIVGQIYADYTAPNFYQSPTRSRARILFTPQHTFIINSGYRNLYYDEAERYLLPELRRRGQKPDHLLLIDDHIFSATATQTLKNAYPHMEIITLFPAATFPFPHKNCTAPELVRLLKKWEHTPPDHKMLDALTEHMLLCTRQAN